MPTLFLIGRIVLGAYYIYNGVFMHWGKHAMLTAYTRSVKVPAAGFAVAATGLMLTLGGLSIMLGVYPKIGVALIVAFLVPVAFMMHNFWTMTDPQMKNMQKIQFMKNIALAASALIMLAIPTPWPWSLGL